MAAKLDIDVHDIDLVEIDERFALEFDGRRIMTADGKHELTHPAPSLLKHIRSEYGARGRVLLESNGSLSPLFFSSYTIYSDQQNFTAIGSWVRQHLSTILRQDASLRLAADPKSAMAQISRLEPLHAWLHDTLGKERFALLRRAAESAEFEANERLVDEFIDNEALKDINPGFVSAEEFAESDLVRMVEDLFFGMELERQSACFGLFGITGNQSLLAPLGLMLGKLTPNEYAQSIMGALQLVDGVQIDVAKEEFAEELQQHVTFARAADEYVNSYRKGLPSQAVRDIIARGEGAQIEFKSTIRRNLNTGKNDDVIVHAWVKTLAAFMNTEGGNLLIGVSDNGTVVGLDQDEFRNIDKAGLFITDILKTSLGAAALTNLRTNFVEVSNRTICWIECRQSDTPVFCKSKGQDEDFFIRLGPSTAALGPRDLLSYQKKRFGPA
ncbi:helix-turn-helix domain-containing protein [Microvirga sp. RSM25]|uniref:AlbA family DNA-binding domain-containing protein n=1 Tax=Microvirga sp. RSM25 TaxID=3273802 RepID=UPI00384AA53D